MSAITSVSRYALQLGQRPPQTVSAPVQTIILALLNNWSDEVETERIWRTDVVQSSSLIAEERRGLAERPYRSQKITLTNMTKDKSLQVLAAISRLSDTRLAFPLYSEVLSPAGGFGTTDTIPVDVRKREFFIGGRVLIWDPRANVMEYGDIAEIRRDEIVLTGATAGTFGPYSLIFPTIDVEVDLTNSLSAITDEVSQVQLELTEVIGQSTLPAWCYGNPPSFPTHEELPVLALGPNWGSTVNVSSARPGNSYDRGKGISTFSRYTRPLYEFAFALQARDRDQCDRLFSFMDSRRGRLLPFWLVSPQKLLGTPQGTWTASTIYVGPTDARELDLDDFLTHIAVVMTNGTIHIEAIDSFASSPTELQIDLSGTIPVIADLSTVAYVTTAHKVRFTNDRWVQQWRTNTVCEAQVIAREVVEEEQVAITNLEDEAPDVSNSIEVDNLLLWFDASHGAIDYNQVRAVDGEEVAKWNLVPGVSIAPITGQLGAYLLPTAARTRAAPWNIPVSASPAFFTLTDSITYRETNPKVNNNNNRPTLEFNTARTLLGVYQATELINKEAPGGVDQGTTIFVCLANMDGAAADTKLFYLPGILEWYPDEIKIFEDYNIDVAANNITFAQIDVTEPEARVLAFRYDPGVQSEAWDAGTSLGTPTTPVSSLAEYSGSGAPNLSIEISFGDAKLNSWVVYNRALSDSELNLVAGSIAASYNAKWTDI